jgi:hypothetical protein
MKPIGDRAGNDRLADTGVGAGDEKAGDGESIQHLWSRKVPVPARCGIAAICWREGFPSAVMDGMRQNETN